MGSCRGNEKLVLRYGIRTRCNTQMNDISIVKGYTIIYPELIHNGVFFICRNFCAPEALRTSRNDFKVVWDMMDHEKIKQGVRLMLEGIGEDVEREGLLETPERIARMCEQIYGGLYEDPATHLNKQFQAINNNIVLEKDITFYSVCEHHLLPFYGKAHVAYIPDSCVAGLSKLARTVEVFARRPQIQENMTAQIADALEKYLKPKGVMVMLEAEHMCMTMRGVQKPGSKTVTTIVRGAFAEDYSLQQTFLQMVHC